VELSLSTPTNTNPAYIDEFDTGIINCTLKSDEPLEDFVFTWTDYDDIPISFDNSSRADFQGVYPSEFPNKTVIFLSAIGEGNKHGILSLKSYARMANAAFTLNGFDDKEQNLTFVKTDFQVSKLKF